MYRTCKSCKIELPLENFKLREDRKGKYAICNMCRVMLCRAKDWPPVEEQGGGRIYIDFDELD